MNWIKKEIEFLPIEIIDGDRGLNYPKLNEFYENEHCLFLNTGNVTLTGFNFTKCQFINIEKDECLRKGKLQRNDVVLTTRGTLGNSGFYSENIVFENIRINSGMVIIRSKNTEELDPFFIYYSIRESNFQTQIANARSGSAQPQLPIGTLKKLTLSKPPLPTQRKIASILSAYDDLIENNLKRIKLLEEQAFLKYKGIVSSENMEEFTIDEVCQTLGGGTPATGNRQFWDEGEILWFSPTDLTKHNSIVLLDSDKKITELGLQKSSAKLVPPKTILMTSRASIGYFGLINKQASTNQGFINMIPFNRHHTAYMLFDLKNRKEEIIGNANGSTFLEISKGKFRQMKMKIPKNEKVLIDFEREFEILFNLIENLLKQNTKLREARDILLPRLMNGQIAV